MAEVSTAASNVACDFIPTRGSLQCLDRSQPLWLAPKALHDGADDEEAYKKEELL